MFLVAISAAWFAAVLVATSRHRSSVLALLVGVTAGFDFAQVANVHLFSFAVGAWVLFSPRGTVFALPPSHALWLSGAAVLMAATVLIGDLVVSSTLALQLLASAGAAWLIGVKATPEDVRLMLRGLLAVVVVSSVWAIAQKFGYLPVREMTGEDMQGRVMGFYHEPDWLGLFSAIGMLITLNQDFRRAAKVALLLLFGTAMVFASARSQLSGLALVAAVTLAFNAWSRWKDRERRRNNRAALAAFAVIGLAALAASPATSAKILERFEGAVNSAERDVSAEARFHQMESLHYLASTAPWHGHGLSAAGRVGVSGDIYYSSASNSVASNWILGWWVDGKFLALPLIAALLLLAARSARNIGGWLLITVLATSMFSNVTMLPIAWFAIGLCFAFLKPSFAASAAHSPALSTISAAERPPRPTYSIEYARPSA